MRLWLVVACAGCGFSIAGTAPDSAIVPGEAGADGAPADAVIDAGVDAPLVAACTVRPTGGATVVQGIGGASGNQMATLACAAGELPIGLAFDVTPGPIASHANQLLLVNIRARCAQLGRTTSNQMITTPAGTVMHVGGMGSSPTACDPYFPTSPSTEVSCPAGQVMVGVEGNQVDTTLYNTVAIRCAPLATDGSVGGSTTTLSISGTGTYQNQPETAVCPAGRAIVSMVARSGCGQDSLTPTCVALTCD